MPRHSIKQLKLTTGEEIVCDVLDESPESIVIRNALVLTANTTDEGSLKYFTFRNFMVFQDTPLNVMLLWTDKIIALAVPTEDMIEQYELALSQLAEKVSELYDKDTYALEGDQTFEEFLKEVEDYRLVDSDTNGFTMN